MRGLKTGGRQKGTPNKVTASAREAIELAFQGLGGVEALTTWAKGNPNEFYTRVWPRILPLQLSGDPESPLIPPPSSSQESSTSKWLREIGEKTGKSGKWRRRRYPNGCKRTLKRQRRNTANTSRKSTFEIFQCRILLNCVHRAGCEDTRWG